MKPVLLAAAFLAVNSAAIAGTMEPRQAEALFTAAGAAARAGRFSLAEERYRELLAAAPTARVRLELARVLFIERRNEEALELFKAVYLERSTPSKVRRNILPFIEELQLRMTRVRYGLNIISDSNPARVGEGGTIYFNGTPLTYDPPRDKATAYGIEPYLSVEKLWPNGFIGKIYGSARLFRDDDLDLGRMRLSLGRRLPHEPNTFVQANLEGELDGFGGSYVLPTIEAWRNFTISRRSRAVLGGRAGYLLSENSEVSGIYARPYSYVDWTFTSNATVFAKASLESLDSRNDYYSYLAPKLEAGIGLNINGFQIVPSIAVTQTRFRQFDPFWGKTRRDLTVRPEVSLSDIDYSFAGITPQLTVFYERRNSNIDIYDYDQLGAYVSLRQLF